jgi:tRNA(Ile)-lysidine synthase TilS/MesJ
MGEKMEKKLYRVKVDLFVMAEDEAEACAAATRARFDIFECTARKADYVASEWNDEIPYNADDERTCAEIMSDKLHGDHPDILLKKLPAYVETAMREFNSDIQSYQPSQQS